MKIWTCMTEGDDMPPQVSVHRTFEEAAEPCRISLREMEWDSRFGSPINTADEIAAAWDLVFEGRCIIQEHELP